MSVLVSNLDPTSERHRENHAAMDGHLARLDELTASAREAGALGAKLTGAGGGGCIFALIEDSGTQVQSCLEGLDAPAFLSRIGAA